MSKLEQQIESDFLTAFKNKQKEVLNVLRLIKSSIKNESIAQKKSELADEDIIKVLKREAKKRQEAISAYQQGQRLELAAKEEKELIIIKQYLPPELGEAEITDLVKEIIKENNSTSPADFGKVMKLAIAKVAGQADGSKVSQIVKELLEQNQ